MLLYTQDELDSLWQRLTEKGSNIDINDPQSVQPLVNLPAMILKRSDKEQEMMFDTSAGEVTSYTDFDVPSEPIPTVIYSRTREAKNKPWGNWIGVFA